MPLAAGTLLGPYEILTAIGAGGMGEVYKARDTRLNRVVAVKVSNQRFSDRFEHEARTIASLNHPHICSLFDVGPDYLVMEYVDGEPLRPTAENRKFLDLAVQIADGMAAAHAAGLVHRDLKPDNILVTRDGRAKILDFGLARQTAAATAAETSPTISITSPGTVVGTVRYMSPEQARGLNVDARSDQFSFGLILYEMTGARPPFRRETAAETLAAIIRDEPEPLPATVPVPLRWTIARCLAKDPAERYGTTRDLYLELRTMRDRLSESHTATAAAAPVRRKFSFAAALLGLALLGAGVLAYLQRTPAAPRVPRYTPFATSGCNEHSPAWSFDGRTLAYVCDVNGVDQVFTRATDSPQAAQITNGKDPSLAPFWSADGARIYFHQVTGLHVTSATGGAPQLLIKDAMSGSLSSDGRRLAFYRPTTRTVWLARADGSEPVECAAKGLQGVRAAMLRFSPDGAYLAVLAIPGSNSGSTLELWTIPVNGGEPQRVAAGLPMYIDSRFSWSDGDRGFILPRTSGENSSISEARHLYEIDRRTGRQQAFTSGPVDESQPAVSPDGKRIAVTLRTFNSDIWEFDARTGKGRPVVAGSRQESAAEWAPSDREFAYLGEVGGRLQVWFRGESGLARALNLSGPPIGEIRWISISPDGNRVGLDTYGAPHRAMVVAAAGGVPVALDPLSKDSHGTDFSPDGNWIVFTRLVTAKNGPQGVLSKVASSLTGQPVDLVTTGSSPGNAVRWSPAGDWIAYLAGAGPETAEVRLVSPDGRRQRTLLEKAYTAWCFDRTGSHIYGVRRGDGRQWELRAVDVASGAERKIAQLEIAPEIQVTHISLHPDGKRLLASIARQFSEIWMIDGITK
jgi:eukaryotic-like serine/threonine-protein kinase